jgi:micrococcal nuclease
LAGAGNLKDRGLRVTVSRVVDGDTVEITPAVDALTEVHLIGVDTPETSHPTYGEQPYGQQAKEFTVTRLEGKRVALEFDLE